MGNFYSNVTLLATDDSRVREVAPRPAFLCAAGDAVVLFAEADDSSPESSQALSQALGCVAFGASVHDDDIFLYEVHRNGELVTGGAIPDPSEYFGMDDDMLAGLDPDMAAVAGLPGRGASPDARAVVDALGRGDESALRTALDGDFVFATERHRAVVQALGLPEAAVGWGYRYLTEDRSSYSGPGLQEL